MSEAELPLFDSNSSFSRLVPGLQVAVDSTSLGEYKVCPRRYYYSIVRGFQPKVESVDLTFGILMHKSREIYDHARATGWDHEGALDWTMDWALRATWNAKLKRPWISGDSAKNRVGLLRAIVWYFDQFADDALETVRLANGQPAVELSFEFDTGLKASSGEAFRLCGHLDRLATWNGKTYVLDVKTTKHGLDAYYFSRFTPDNQFSLYILASKIVFASPAEGLILDAIQIGTDFVRCQRGPIPRSEAEIDEWWNDTQVWLRQMDDSARSAHWPMNDKACGLYGGCQFRPVCSRPPAAREAWLRADYAKRVWDPLAKRGDC